MYNTTHNMPPRFGESRHQPFDPDFKPIESPANCVTPPAPLVVTKEEEMLRPDTTEEAPDVVAPVPSKKKVPIDVGVDVPKQSTSSASSAPIPAVNPVTTPPVQVDPEAAKSIADAVESAPMSDKTQLFHLKTAFKPHVMKPNAKMKAQDCYGIAIQKNASETTVSMYHCPAVKGTCPSKLSDACTVTEITRIPSTVDVSKKVEETLLMRY